MIDYKIYSKLHENSDIFKRKINLTFSILWGIRAGYLNSYSEWQREMMSIIKEKRENQWF